MGTNTVMTWLLRDRKPESTTTAIKTQFFRRTPEVEKYSLREVTPCCPFRFLSANHTRTAATAVGIKLYCSNTGQAMTRSRLPAIRGPRISPAEPPEPWREMAKPRRVGKRAEREARAEGCHSDTPMPNSTIDMATAQYFSRVPAARYPMARRAMEMVSIVAHLPLKRSARKPAGMVDTPAETSRAVTRAPARKLDSMRPALISGRTIMKAAA